MKVVLHWPQFNISFYNTEPIQIGKCAVKAINQRNNMQVFSIIINENLLGHGVVLQFLDSELGPSMLQSLPPFAGAGAVHDLVFCCIPPPQVALHGE